jgi:hypothetical protein
MARVLVATHEKQGQRKNDFCWATDGELVTLPMECDGEAVDGGCGCRRCFSGVESFRSTTTAKVVDRPDMDKAALTAVLAESLDKAGWAKSLSKKTVASWAKRDAAELLRIAARFHIGDVVEKRGNAVQVR